MILSRAECPTNTISSNSFYMICSTAATVCSLTYASSTRFQHPQEKPTALTPSPAQFSPNFPIFEVRPNRSRSRTKRVLCSRIPQVTAEKKANETMNPKSAPLSLERFVAQPAACHVQRVPATLLFSLVL